MSLAIASESEKATMLIHPQLFSRASDQWFILHTLSNQEKALASAMHAMDLPYFLPLRRVVRIQGRQRTLAMLPLFPNYLFIRGTLDEVYRADRTKRVASVVRVFDQQRLESEVRSIHLALIHHGTMTPQPFLKEGIRVEVRAGPFRGMRGLIEDRTKDNRLILNVDVLGQATALEIDGSLLEPI